MVSHRNGEKSAVSAVSYLCWVGGGGAAVDSSVIPVSLAPSPPTSACGLGGLKLTAMVSPSRGLTSYCLGSPDLPVHTGALCSFFPGLWMPLGCTRIWCNLGDKVWAAIGVPPASEAGRQLRVAWQPLM